MPNAANKMGANDGNEERRVVLNLVGDRRFTHAVSQAVAEICGRYKKSPTMPELMAEALAYSSRFTGDELWIMTCDAYLYGPEKKGGINLTNALDRHLAEVVRMARQSTNEYCQAVRWTKRRLGVAAMYLYCAHVAQNHGERYTV